MAIKKYFPKGGGKDDRAESNDSTRTMRSIGKHYAKDAALKKRTTSTSKHQPYLDEKNRGGKFQ